MNRRSMRTKLIFVFIYTSIFVLLADLFIYYNINQKIEQINRIYSSNVNLNEVSNKLADIQTNVYQYLNTKSSESLEAYYASSQDYGELCKSLNQQVSDNEIQLMEKNISEMSTTYLDYAEEAVQAKRGRNTEKYKERYEASQQMYTYIKDYLTSLNNLQFKYNSHEYLVLQESIKYLEVVSIIVLTALIALTTVIIFILTSQLTRPLMRLAKSADEVAKGNFDIDLVEVQTKDEVETLSKAFNTMVVSIREYIDRLRKSMEVENQMKERELIMENHLKDAQLKYLQAQINPHFLFNTLNAGVQLAVMENAEKTSVYIENVAEFFRYNITDLSQDTTVGEEIHLAEYYIYILNVRFSNEIGYEKQIEESLLSVRMPRMILQPLVENAFNYGIRDKEGSGNIRISVTGHGDYLHVSVSDNGNGMTAERIKEVLSGEVEKNKESKASNGVGLINVIKRLKLYYKTEDVLDIISETSGGTTVTIRIPKERENLDV